MFSLVSQVAASILLSASTLIGTPDAPKNLSFNASAYVTTNHQIRVDVIKNADMPVIIMLRDKHNHVLYQQNLSKKELTYAVKLDVQELVDGDYELEVKSSEGSIRKQLNLSTTPVQQTARIIAMQ